MKPISNDLRRRIIEAIQANEESQPEIAERFSVSLSMLEKLWHRFRTTGSYETKPQAGGRARLLKAEEVYIRAEVAAQPDITLAELSSQVLARNNQAAISLMTMSNELRRLGLPRKKR
jgi:transposase